MTPKPTITDRTVLTTRPLSPHLGAEAFGLGRCLDAALHGSWPRRAFMD